MIPLTYSMFMTREKVSAHWEKLENMTEENGTGSVCSAVRNLRAYVGCTDVTLQRL